MVLAAALAVLALFAFAPGSGAAAACPLITDRSGDGPAAVGNEDSLDILSADISSDAKAVTAVFRVKGFPAVSPGTPQGRHYYLLFNTLKPAAKMFLNVTLFNGGAARYAWGSVSPVDPLGALILYDDGNYGLLRPASGVIDTAKKEIRVTAPVADMAKVGNVKPGSTLSRISAETFYSIGFFIFDSDVATAKSAYVAGSPGCVPTGK